jgi:ubiquinone/menaquinone biosynthesis C-methylase UbiE
MSFCPPLWLTVRWLTVALLFAATPVLAAKTDIDGYANTGVTLDGIGKSYMGREIAGVMGHEGADWLDRANRDAEEGSTRLVPLLGLKSSDAVADIGAGTGYFTFRMSAAVPTGKVYAVDIQPEMLDVIKARQTKTVGANITTVQGSIADPRLPPAGIDLILLVDAYHEFSYPREMGLAMVRALRPGGRIALVEYRGEDKKVPIRDVHRMTEAQAKREMTVLGLTWQRTDESLPWQHVMFFAKPTAP